MKDIKDKLVTMSKRLFITIPYLSPDSDLYVWNHKQCLDLISDFKYFDEEKTVIFTWNNKYECCFIFGDFPYFSMKENDRFVLSSESVFRYETCHNLFEKLIEKMDDEIVKTNILLCFQCTREMNIDKMFIQKEVKIKNKTNDNHQNNQNLSYKMH